MARGAGAGEAQPARRPTQPRCTCCRRRPKWAEAYYAFAARVLADQSRFMEALSQAMATT
jgi:hypothetical protein